ncbi:Crp/Fnr family transcriptional regulator [Sphingomonas sp.]|jgi:CRP-like cAMP-binding protein|uniref:Crp/Fnr family transcriptional regulator n=1 Tax=Sphingomonas sp. TaxID=28214 RepID=UPI002ED7FAE3
MPAERPDTFGSVIRKLQRLTRLDDADREAIAALSFTLGRGRASHYIVRERDQVSNCCILLSGYACRHKTTSDGGRQIVSFHLPGDILDVQHLLFPGADHNVQTITEATWAVVPSEALRKVSRDRPAIAEALWKDSLIDASVFREWVLNVGRRDAKSRVAHMLCEFAVRREAAGLGSPERFELPMSQEHIADATGLTPVHVNRMLHALSDDGIIARDKRRVDILDWARMRRVADFDPIYLHEAA